MYSTRTISLCGVVERDRTMGGLRLPYYGQTGTYVEDEQTGCRRFIR